MRSLSMETEFKHFDISIRKQLEICLDSENLTDALEQKIFQIFSPENGIDVIAKHFIF